MGDFPLPFLYGKKFAMHCAVNIRFSLTPSPTLSGIWRSRKGFTKSTLFLFCLASIDSRGWWQWALYVATAIAGDLGDCEWLTLLPLPSLMYCWLCVFDLWTTQKPTKRVTWEAVFFASLFLQSFINFFFQRISPGGDLSNLLLDVKEIKNSFF